MIIKIIKRLLLWNLERNGCIVQQLRAYQNGEYGIVGYKITFTVTGINIQCTEREFWGEAIWTMEHLPWF